MTILFGVSTGSIAPVLWGALQKYVTSMAVSGLAVLVLGSASFAAKALVFVVRNAAGFVFLTVDLTARGVVGAGRALAGALPHTSPPPAAWHIQDNYKTVHRSLHLPPEEPKRLAAPKDAYVDPQELARLAGVSNVDLSASFVELPEDQLATMLGKSKANNKATQSQQIGLASSAVAAPSNASPPLTSPICGLSQSTTYNSNVRTPSPVRASPQTITVRDYPVATVSQDAIAGYLTQSLRNFQQSKQPNTPDEAIEQAILADPEFAAPSNAEPGYAARRLEATLDLHASQLRQHDPIVDSWMDVSAPALGE